MQRHLPVVCDLCGKSFRSSSGLSGHKQWVHGVKAAQKRLFGETKRLADEGQLEALEIKMTQMIQDRLQQEEKKLLALAQWCEDNLALLAKSLYAADASDFDEMRGKLTVNREGDGFSLVSPRTGNKRTRRRPASR